MPTEAYLLLGGLLFALGAAGVVTRTNALSVLVAVELMLNAVNLTFVAAARRYAQLDGGVVAFFVITVAAAEVAVGLGIVIDVARRTASVDVDEASELRG
ncbi:MAG TPA: NADH-quinone oxidoreductase subunit NuoK [Candidatus Limnocylindria bacterium]|nr:NADH-quinone oxidoreductase subunit NuoK [Candidatus Limnocylindria bacterium]